MYVEKRVIGFLKCLCLITSNYTRVCVNDFRMCYRLTYEVFFINIGSLLSDEMCSWCGCKNDLESVLYSKYRVL